MIYLEYIERDRHVPIEAFRHMGDQSQSWVEPDADRMILQLGRTLDQTHGQQRAPWLGDLTVKITGGTQSRDHGFDLGRAFGCCGGGCRARGCATQAEPSHFECGEPCGTCSPSCL